MDKCPSCRLQFDVKKNVESKTSKIPLVLHCKHILCEECISRRMLTRNNKCPICHAQIRTLGCDFSKPLYEVFPPHFSLLGHVIWKRHTFGINDSETQELTLIRRQNRIQSDIETISHDSNSIIYEDTIKIEENNIVGLYFDDCLKHLGFPLNLMCETCNLNICCNCFVENHSGHERTLLYNLDEKELEELDELKTNSQNIIKKLIRIQKKKDNFNTKYMEEKFGEKISSFFFKLHTDLYLAENHLQHTIKSTITNEQKYENTKEKLQTYITNIHQLLSTSNKIKTNQVNVKFMLNEFKKIQELCSGLEFDYHCNQSDNIFSLSTALKLDNLDNYSIEIPNIEKFQLLSLNNLEKAASTNKKSEVHTPTTKNEHFPKKSHEMYSTKSINSGNTSISIDSSQFNTYLNDQTYNISHITNLKSFFIKKKHDIVFDEISMRMKKIKQRIPDKKYIKIGNIFCVQEKGYKYWQRGKINKIVESEGENILEIFYLDYGNTANVTLDKLSLIDHQTIKYPPCAVECKLNISDEMYLNGKVILHFSQIVNRKDVIVKLLKSDEDPIEVDLLIIDSKSNQLSITNILKNFIEPNSIINTPKAQISSTSPVFLENSKKFKHGEPVQVIITYVESPFKIAVQLVDNLIALENLYTQMSEYYSEYKKSCYPVVGSSIIVKKSISLYGIWHRAVVISVETNTNLVQVFLVDWGFNSTVEFNQIYFLSSIFTKIERQAIFVKLAHVDVPELKTEWEKETTPLLREKLVNNGVFKMLLNSDENNLLEVALFKCDDENSDFCINAFLVEEGLALSTGIISETLKWKHKPKTEVFTENTFSIQLIHLAEENLINIKHQNNEDFPQQMQTVSITTCKNPYEFGIKFTKNEALEHQLFEELQVFYTESIMSSEKRHTNFKNWKVGDICVVKDEQKRFMRGRIEEALSECKFRVFLLDQISTLICASNEIYKYDIYFLTNYPDGFNYKCCLDSVKPAGDSIKWSHLATEIFQAIFNTYKTIYLYKSRNEEHTDNCIYVKMWYLITMEGGALEPAKSHLVSIADVLINSGVALRSLNKVENLKITTEDEQQSNNDKTKSTIISSNTNELTIDLNKLELKKKCSWTTPPRMLFDKFKAVLTCLDDTGIFFVRDLEFDALYKKIEQMMKAHFDENGLEFLDNDSDQIHQWSLGQYCTVIFDDGNYYRAIVQSICNDTSLIEVLMIDFGSVHMVKKNQLSREIMYQDVCPLVYSLKMANVVTKCGDSWSMDDIDILHQYAAYDIFVEVKCKLNEKVPEAELYAQGSTLSINELFVMNCKNAKRQFITENGNNESLKEEITSISSDFDSVENEYCFKFEPIEVKSRIRVKIMSIFKLDKIILKLCETKNDNSYDKKLNDLENEMNKSINDSMIEKLLVIDNHKPCVCLSPKTMKYSRGLIIDTGHKHHNFVTVFIVDHGIVEILNVTDLHEMKQEWLDLPILNYIARINGHIDNMYYDIIVSYLNNFIKKVITAEIVDTDPILIVNLFNLKDEEEKNVLIYQNLFDLGIIS